MSPINFVQINKCLSSPVTSASKILGKTLFGTRHYLSLPNIHLKRTYLNGSFQHRSRKVKSKNNLLR